MSDPRGREVRPLAEAARRNDAAKLIGRKALALAAYNAGPGNIRAGYGYADGILKQAGASSVSTSSG